MHDPLDPTSRELIGIAAAVAGHCQPCFAYHYGKAVELGVPAEAIRAAMHLAKAIRASGDQQMDEFATRRTAPGGPGPEDDINLGLPKL